MKFLLMSQTVYYSWYTHKSYHWYQFPQLLIDWWRLKRAFHITKIKIEF
jgi:hypothetical protein